MYKYQVIYRLKNAVPISDGPQDFSRIGVSFETKDENLLGITHVFESSRSLDNESILSESKASLTLLLEIIEYRYGLPITFKSRHSKCLSEDQPSTGSLKLTMDACIVSSVAFPAPSLVEEASEDLCRWIRLMNDARNSPSDAEAIKLYDMIQEGMYGKSRSTRSPEAWNLKIARDFVSHGNGLTGKQHLDFLAMKIAEGTNTFNPQNPNHLEFVKEMRKVGRGLLESEINARIS